MRKLLIVSAAAFAMATAAGYAFASGDDARSDAPRDQWLTVAQITEKFTAEGYDVRQVKIEDGGYEIYAIKDGQRIEGYVDPITGALQQGVDADD